MERERERECACVCVQTCVGWMDGFDRHNETARRRGTSRSVEARKQPKAPIGQPGERASVSQWANRRVDARDGVNGGDSRGSG